jgi:uncharacterized membrane protein
VISLNKSIKIFIVCSVVLNIFFIGFIVGKITYRTPTEEVGQMVSELPPIKREIANKLLNTGSAEDRAKVAELRNVRKGIVDELNAAEFNADDYQKKLDELERIRTQLKEHYTMAVKEMASNFTVEERRTLVKALVKRRATRAGKSPFTTIENKSSE